MKYFQFNGLLLSSGWMSPAFVGIDNEGIIKYLSTTSPQDAIAVEAIKGFALPGFQNAHSHAFQFSMAGQTETHPRGSSDDFWSWREAMYKCAMQMEPDQMQAVATMLYAEMLRTGYTHVAEFHYLHHDKKGKHYSNLAEMGERLIAAANTAGIKITLVPVFYQKGGFGKPFQPRQIRFISDTIDEYFQLLDDTATAVAKDGKAKLGYGVHSLRAVEAEDVIRTVQQGPTNIPFHIHAAEQLREVEDCIASVKQRPVEWLLNNLPLDNRFHLIHCTHLTDDEVKRLAASGAHAVLCPGTEGNLGDGIFRLSDFAFAGGTWSIGTDSHISLNPIEDMRWLDYGQRLLTHKRNTFDEGASIMINKTLLSGRKAMGNTSMEYFSIGEPLDTVVYNAESPLLAQASEGQRLSSIVYTADSSSVLGTIVNGRWIVKRGKHLSEETIRKEFLRHIIKLD